MIHLLNSAFKPIFLVAWHILFPSLYPICRHRVLCFRKRYTAMPCISTAIFRPLIFCYLSPRPIITLFLFLRATTHTPDGLRIHLKSVVSSPKFQPLAYLPNETCMRYSPLGTSKTTFPFIDIPGFMVL